MRGVGNATSELNIEYKVCDATSYGSGSVLPPQNLMVLSRKYILIKSQQCGSHCNKKKTSTMLVAFSFLLRGKSLHLICFVNTESLAEIFHLYFALLGNWVFFLIAERDEGTGQGYQK